MHCGMRELRVEIKTQLINNVKAVWDIEECERSRERKTWKTRQVKMTGTCPTFKQYGIDKTVLQESCP